MTSTITQSDEEEKNHCALGCAVLAAGLQLGSMALHRDILRFRRFASRKRCWSWQERGVSGRLSAVHSCGSSAVYACGGSAERWRRHWRLRFRRIEELLAPLVLAMKTIPVASFIILALIWIGSKNLAVLIAVPDGVPDSVYERAFRHTGNGCRAAGNGCGSFA